MFYSIYVRADFTAAMKAVSSCFIFLGLFWFCSIIFTILEPIITPSAPAFATSFACWGVLIPKPTQIGTSVRAFSLVIRGFTVSDSFLRSPVTPKMLTV